MLSELCGNVFQVASFYWFLSDPCPSSMRRVTCGSEFAEQTWQGWRGCEQWSDLLSLLKQSCACPTPEGELAAGPQSPSALLTESGPLDISPKTLRSSGDSHLDTLFLSPVGAEETVNRHLGELSLL